MREKSRCGEEVTYAKKTAQKHRTPPAVGDRLAPRYRRYDIYCCMMSGALRP
jgi:hypothetical protein